MWRYWSNGNGACAQAVQTIRKSKRLWDNKSRDLAAQTEVKNRDTSINISRFGERLQSSAATSILDVYLTSPSGSVLKKREKPLVLLPWALPPAVQQIVTAASPDSLLST